MTTKPTIQDSDYHRQYYLDHKDKLLPRIREYNKDKYDNNIKYKLLKRYQSRIDNYFGTQNQNVPRHKAEDLLHCTPQFFVEWIEWCLKDQNRARYSWDNIEIGHVRPVTTFDNNDLTGWCWVNTLPQTEGRISSKETVDCLTRKESS
jgi:hypothetical protein